ncbi:hypothetical protein AD998_05725 [bacterium 336/3]|jgi:hypothetical protein|nr:hypothetical protein AD998_05725 [bacterium 336/3]
MNLFENLTGLLQGDTVKNMAKQFGVDENTVQQVVAMGLPMILGGLNKNASNEQGAQSLDNALQKHDGGLLGNLTSMLTSNSSSLLQDGMGILKHVLGNTQQPAQNQISKSVGLDAGVVGNILALAAPVVMSFLGQQKKEQGLDVKGVVNIVNTTTQQAPQQEMGLIQKFLDRDGDGSILDDVMDIGSKFLGSFFSNKNPQK